MNVLHCTVVHRRFDGRIFERQCIGLVQRHDVRLIVADGLAPQDIGGVSVFSINNLKGNGEKAGRLLKSLRMFWYLIRHKRGYSIVHAHDPELIWVVALLRILTLGRVKAIYDKHEDTQKQILIRTWIPRTTRLLISKCYFLYEYTCFKIVNCVVHVAPNIMDTSCCRCNILVRNFPSIALLEGNSFGRAYIMESDEFVLFYPGSLSEARGITSILDSLRYLPASVRLVLMGKWVDEKYQEFCRSHDEWHRVDYQGVQEWTQVVNQMQNSHAVMQVPLSVGQYSDGMYSLKVFEALASGVPVVVSDSENRRSVYGEAVFYVESGNSREIARAVENIRHSPQLIDDKIELGKRYIREKYNWEAELNRLNMLYDELQS